MEESHIMNKQQYRDIAACFQSASSGKSLIAAAITGKGVSTEANASFQTMAENINAIKIKTNLITSTTTAIFKMGAGGGRQYQEKTISLPSNYDPASSYILIAKVYAMERCAQIEVNMVRYSGTSAIVGCTCSNEGNTVEVTIRFVGLAK